jgi:hypothetical protein
LLARGNRSAVAFDATTVWLNVAPARLIQVDGAATSLVVENGRITRIYVMRNQPKLAR